MHARHALHDADGIRALHRALTNALADLDTQPAEQPPNWWPNSAPA